MSAIAPPKPERTDFVFVVCQKGSEAATKEEILANHANLKLSFSRPGFVTFKIDPENPLPLRFSLKSTLARTAGWSAGKLTGEDADALIPQLIGVPLFASADRVHVWQRDAWLPGKNGFEPVASEPTREVASKIESASNRSDRLNHYAQADELVLDIILVEPNQWWWGFHYATTPAGRWPGGAPQLDVTKKVISRAYFKLKEALMWSGIKLGAADVCAEIGSAPGGACQLLLELGCEVIGVDPAEMETEISKHPKFTHIRRRGHEVKRKDFSKVNWLLADLNVDPQGTVDSVSEIAAHRAVNLKGMILTVKMSDWKAVGAVPKMIGQLRKLGFQVVKARQLAFNRREFCLVAIKNKITLRKMKK